MLTQANELPPRGRRSEGGVALLHVLIIGGALFGIAVAALGLSRFDLMITNNLVNGTKARWIAIAGAEAAKDWLAANGADPCLDTLGGCPGGPQAMGDGTYEYTIERHPALASRLRITSTGTAPNHALKIVEEVIIAPGFDPEHGLIQIDGDAVPVDLEESGQVEAPGYRIPSWTIDGQGYSAATGLPDPACTEVPPVGGRPDPTNTGMPSELDELRCKIVQRANECCNADGTTNRDACVLQEGACQPGTCEDASCAPGACAIGSCLPGVCLDGTCVAGECAIGTCGPGACADGVTCASGYCEVGSCTPGDCAVGSACAAGTCETSNCRAGGTCSPGDPTCVTATCNSKGKACRPGNCSDGNCTAGVCDVGTCSSGSCGGGSCIAATCTLNACGPGACPAGATCVTAGCPASGCGPGDACTSGTCVAATCAATCGEGEDQPCDPSGLDCVTATCSLPGCRAPLCPFDPATATGLCEWEPGLATVRGTLPDHPEPRFDSPYFTDLDETDGTTTPPPEWASWAQDCNEALPDCCKQMSLSDAALRPGTLGSTPPRGPLRIDKPEGIPVEAMTEQQILALRAAIEATLDAALLAPASDKVCIVEQHIRGGTHEWGNLANPKITIVSTPNDQNAKVQALSRSAPCTTGPGDGANNLVLKDGAVVDGAGVLILPRQLDVEDATFDFKGLVVVLENGKVVALRDACGEICGGLLLQTNNDRNNARLDLDKNLASGSCLRPNNAFSITRCCDALDGALQLLSPTVSWREVFVAP